MSVARLYVMIAAEGKSGELEAALRALAAKVLAIPGCEDVEILRDSDSPDYFMFIERWPSIEAHKAGGPALGRDALRDVLAALSEPPQARYLAYLPPVAGER